jgi:hypothetical protein
VLAGLMREQSEQIQRVTISGFDGQHLPVELFGLASSPV